MERNTFVFYKDWMDAIKGLPDDVRLDIYKGICEYGLNNSLIKSEIPIVNTVISFIKKQIDKDITTTDRYTSSYSRWRKAVLLRYCNTCQKCGSVQNIHVHHIIRYADAPELRFEIDNGLTVCLRCHLKIHHG